MILVGSIITKVSQLRLWRRFGINATSELNFLGVKRYIKKYCEVEMLGLQNTNECDVNFVNLGVFNFAFFDSINGIMKLITFLGQQASQECAYSLNAFQGRGGGVHSSWLLQTQS